LAKLSNLIGMLKYFILTLISVFALFYLPAASATTSDEPTVHDPNLRVDLVVRGLDFPSNMAFLGPDDILVLEKNKGTVQRILKGSILHDPVLDVNVATEHERGLLGIAIARLENGPTYVFLSFTEVNTISSTDCPPAPSECNAEDNAMANRLYRYEWIDNELVNQKLILELSASPGPQHNGGETIIGPDGNIYLTIGDLRGESRTNNIGDSPGLNITSGILRITKDGHIVDEDIIGTTYPLSLYYAYGIRNSFGMDFDPMTGTLWDTENGPLYGDEINLVEPGFNSGWREVHGIWQRCTSKSCRVEGNNPGQGPIDLSPSNLEDFGGRGKYSVPEFVWLDPIGVTALKFLNSEKLGNDYQNDIFVGDFNGGNIYHFDLNQNRTDLALEGLLADKVADTAEQSQGILFGEGFHTITDLQVGPDGYLYVLSAVRGDIYRIVPRTTNAEPESQIDTIARAVAAIESQIGTIAIAVVAIGAIVTIITIIAKDVIVTRRHSQIR